MTFTERLVNSLSTRWGGGVGRRSFLAGAAVVGSALATHPVQYATRPVTAMASVCGDGAACDEGWSAFCCTISGANQCPPGSFVAGWWKADRSGFCCGSARYYIDCNASCGSDWTCHCASGTCDQRRVACNQFRYGQCHQEIDCYGPVVCRVITCTPPWQFDAACGTTSLTDNATATHSAPCLLGNCPSDIDQYWHDHGGAGGPFGDALAAEQNGANGGRFRSFQNAVLFSVGGVPVQALKGSLLGRYRSAGGPTGVLGFPSGAVTVAGTTTSVPFQRGAIYHSPATGAHALYGDFLTAFRRIGGAGSGLGLPTAERESRPGGRLRTRFAHGVIYWSESTGAHQVSGPVYSRWRDLGEDSAAMGLPVADQLNSAGRQIGRFQYGVIAYSAATGARAVTGPILTRWNALGGADGSLGLPTTEISTASGGRSAQRFQRGGIYRTPSAGAQALNGTFWEKWLAIGTTATGMGYPISGRRAAGAAQWVDFEDGVMFYSAATGVHWIQGTLYKGYLAFGGRGKLGLPTRDRYVSGGKLRIDCQRGSLVQDRATGKVTRL